ncbi:MAG: hypothetical protein JSW49_06915 [candidate division WOR-3 bacterium]|nr:MAG: hypothetical protein JSW49_06915 [candidate division WOR-3 bacterium]
MKDFLTQLKEQNAEFGNHYRKYLQSIQRNLDPLIQRLEERKKRDAVHILHPTYDFETEIGIIAGIGDDRQEKLNFINTFFSLQFLLMNRQAVDHLRMGVMAPTANKYPVYKKFMIDAGNNFRMLTAHYINQLLPLFVDKERCPSFVILGVGTKADQDDIDVGIIDDGTRDRHEFNRAISQIAQEMLKSAVSFHFHLSEHIGGQYYSASIDEYKKALKHQIGDYVIINEMLSGAVITGDVELFKKYQHEITRRYFYHTDSDNKYHEGYLRGILGEISSMLAKPVSPNHIHFKEDGLRIIKNIICAQKTVYDVDKVNAWQILADLRKKNPGRVQEYHDLERSLTFFEVFRYLYQLLVTQDEELELNPATFKNIRTVARNLGYTDLGKCHAQEHVLVHYYEHIQSVRNIVPTLLDDLKSHLEANSIFVTILNPDYSGNIAQDFLTKFKFFRGTSFWDDILDDFENETVLNRFIKDLDAFPPDKRSQLIDGYIEWVKYDLYSSIKFLTILGRSKVGHALYDDLNSKLLDILASMPDVPRKIAYVFNRFPQLINDYLSLNTENNLKRYLTILETRLYEKEIAAIIESLKSLVDIHLSSSLFFKRYLMRITGRYPETMHLLKDNVLLKEFGDGLYSDVQTMPTLKEKKEKLGDYYDFEMTRVGLKTLSGAPTEDTSVEFTEFSDKYIITLFDVCRREVDKEYTKRIITDDLLAIFAAGGHAREQAYDDDYDIIVLLNSDNAEMLSYCNKIISKMNGEIIKHGTIPHHRFADYFGRYVILLEELEHLLSEKRPDIFIEKSQILGSRLVVGTHRFEKEFFDRIIRPYIFEQKDEYIRQMIGEITSRHQTNEAQRAIIEDNIKEGSGGLRDLEMILLILKAQCNMVTPVNSQLFTEIAERQRALRKELYRLASAFIFLNNLRNCYRLTIGATDMIAHDTLGPAARLTGYENGKVLFDAFKNTCGEVQQTIMKIIKKLPCP